MQATARILARDGWDALTTNRVALEAGVSVGSLYQYFPNKEALVVGLVDRWSGLVAQKMVSELRAIANLPIGTCIRRMVQSALEATDADVAMYRAVLLQLPRLGAVEIFERWNRSLVDAVADWIVLRRRELHVEDPTLTAWMVVTCLDSVVDYALVLRPELLESQRFPRELERMVAGCLGVRAPPRPRASR